MTNLDLAIEQRRWALNLVDAIEAQNPVFLIIVIACVGACLCSMINLVMMGWLIGVLKEANRRERPTPRQTTEAKGRTESKGEEQPRPPEIPHF